MATFHFELLDLPPEAEALRTEVREFLRERLADRAPHKRARSWGGFDREFTEVLIPRLQRLGLMSSRVEARDREIGLGD